MRKARKLENSKTPIFKRSGIPAKPKKVLLLGSGALKIGQAGEFDYSGSQALKALREEGIKSVLINPNIATIQTDEGMANATYFLPVEPYFVEKVIKKEKCDAIFLSFGGQSALNCGLALEESGVLKKLGCRVLGTPVKTIRDTEDRALFVDRLKEIGVLTARSRAVTSTVEALKAAKAIGYPVMLRSGFSLGGQGSAIAYNEKEAKKIADTAFASLKQILVEECLKGWKEIEYEVVRDASDNCITVCNMENFDPMGVHTGESIVVAPSQTLDDHEYQMLRDIAIKTIRHLGIVGECNIQYALNPDSREYRVIEVNARLSRSSALASKATGYPLAYVAAKIGLGYDLPEIPNSITKVTTAFFEPALDYIVCKVPRWDLDKFDQANTVIGSEMKSVGEVMAIGRSFPEALQKALRMLEIGADGLDPHKYEFDDLEWFIKNPTPRRIFAIAQALYKGMAVEKISKLSSIDKFFLYELKRTIGLGQEIVKTKGGLKSLTYEKMRDAKLAGFSDKLIASCLKTNEEKVLGHRWKLGLRPKISQIDTLAAEYPAETNFLYFSYAATENDAPPTNNKKLLVLGSGCYRIGSSVEFDWCAVSAVKEAKKLGYETLLLNCNPETVSTDYDVCDRLIFDEISLETVLELCDIEKPEGVIVSMGGQTPNNLALKLAAAGVKIFGTDAKSIDIAEDRSKFSHLLDDLKIDQPLWAKSTDVKNIGKTVKKLGGYPVLVRPSYVLSGAAMRIANSPDELNDFLYKATDISREHPVVISKFEEFAREVEFDAVANKGEVVLWALSEHIENAGVHSGDATLVIPPQRLAMETMIGARDIGKALAKALKITGPFNIQLLAKNNEIKVIECNLRASRSFPFISKTLKVNFIAEATKIMLGANSNATKQPKMLDLNYVAVKASQFSFSRLKGVDPRLRVEMASTGEVGCFGRDTDEALLSAMLAVGFKIPKKAAYISIEPDAKNFNFTHEAELLRNMGLKLFTSQKTAERFADDGIKTTAVSEKLNKNSISAASEMLQSGTIDLVICIPGTGRARTSREGFVIRRTTADLNIPLITDIWLARRLVQAVAKYKISDIGIKSWGEYVGIKE